MMASDVGKQHNPVAAKLRPVVSHFELEMIVHAFVSSRLNDCNSLFTFLNRLL